MDKDIIRLYTDGHTITEIREELQIGYARVKKVISKAGIIRSKSDTVKLSYQVGRKNADHFRNTNKGSNNPSWRGGRIKLKGYIRGWVPEDPYADPKGYVSEHRLVMEAHIGRYLHGDEHIHHKDGIRHNNNVANLQIISLKEHSSLTRRENRLRLWEKSETYKLIRDHKTELERLRKQGFSYQKIADVLGSKMPSVRYAFMRNLNLSPSWTPIDLG